MRKLTSDDIMSITPYAPGKPVEELERELGITGSIKLASNENPVGPSPKALAAIPAVLSSLHRYPDGNAFCLKDAIAAKFGVRTDEIILGNGSNELLEIVVRTFLLEGEEAIYAEPSFAVYRLAAQACGRKSIAVPLKDGRHDLSGMADHITEKTKIIFIANPNNPTGTINSGVELAELVARTPKNTIIVMDEAYYEYVTDPAYADSMKYFMDGRNIIILRTFSKIYGLAGLRIGYGFAPAHLVDLMNRVRAPFNTNSVGQAAAVAALSDDEHVLKAIAVNEEGKKYLYPELDSLGINYVPTQANFIYMDLGHDTREVYNALLKQGVIIRPMGPTQIRVTIGLPAENTRFIDALSTVVKGWRSSN
ncbi:MAG TPA: histidinol-phosphate transaminase [Nitrospirota bacterium]